MEYLEQRRDRIERRLESVLDGTEPAELREQMGHVTLAGGKRVRPTVTVLVCDALDGDMDAAVEFAVGIELVHNASLVIDDIIDESELRRGTKAAWTAYGFGPAITASDGLIGEAFALFSSNERAMQAVAESMVNLGEGEATELVAQPVTEEEYMELARRKTGALFRAAAELGAIAADADPFTVEAFGNINVVGQRGLMLALVTKGGHPLIKRSRLTCRGSGAPVMDISRSNSSVIARITSLTPSAPSAASPWRIGRPRPTSWAPKESPIA